MTRKISKTETAAIESLSALGPGMRRRLKPVLKVISVETAKIAASRDKLRALISDLEDIAGTADEAVEDIERAVETLSQYL